MLEPRDEVRAQVSRLSVAKAYVFYFFEGYVYVVFYFSVAYAYPRATSVANIRRLLMLLVARRNIREIAVKLTEQSCRCIL